MSKHLVNLDIEYLGDLHCTVTHGPSGQTFMTDAPLDNNGKGEFISPTDLLAAASASCVATIMGIKAKNNDIDIKGMTVNVVKEMASEPFRKVGKLTMLITFPHKLNDKDFQIMKNVIKTCPVTRSIRDDVEIDVTYKFADEEN